MIQIEQGSGSTHKIVPFRYVSIEISEGKNDLLQ
tara:strand:+ start:112 stop:213 length:102 start_codon:yes stop_codon:yes gene_type:complete